MKLYNFRPKVQAQRKFAQVCGGSASSKLPASLLASQSTQNENAKTDSSGHDPPQELLPNRRPNTEDFLTFLCFRGTSVLPSHLDFFNTNKNADQQQQQAKQKTETSIASCSSKEIKQEEKRPEAKNVGKGADTPKFIPFAVRKRADTVAVGSRKQTVQALKKKYQEQRIAKNKAQCKTRSFTAKEAETSKLPKSKSTETNVKKTAVNDSPGKGGKRKLRGSVGNGQLCEEITVTKSQKIPKDTVGRPPKAVDTNKVSDEVEPYKILIILLDPNL